jgi:hypothetical protein
MLKLSFLNHSKWNRNGHSNYVVDLKIYDKDVNSYTWFRAIDSEYELDFNRSEQLLVRFYFPKMKDNECTIGYVEKCLNFKKIISYYNEGRPVKIFNTLDYELEFDDNYSLVNFLAYTVDA